MEKSKKKSKKVTIFTCRSRHMNDHFTNLYPQLIKKQLIMDKVKDFIEYVWELYSSGVY
jgi:hypothetical protein